MPKKKKPKPFRAVTAVKALARERIGSPRPEQVEPGTKKGKAGKSGEKHKETLGKLLQED